MTKKITDKRLFDFADEMEILQRLDRTGYVMTGVPKPQSVAAHIFGVALWSMLLMDRMRENNPQIDQAKVLKMAILHEVGETRIGDIPYPARKYLGNQNVSKAEEAAVNDLFEGFSVHWFESWLEFEKADSLEANIVKAADRLEMMHKILCYERHHSGCLEKFWAVDANFRWSGIQEAKELFEQMKAMHQNNILGMLESK